MLFRSDRGCDPAGSVPQGASGGRWPEGAGALLGATPDCGEVGGAVGMKAGGGCRSWAVMDPFAPRKPSASWSTTAASSTTMSAWPLCSWTALASGSLGAWTTCIQPRAMVGDLPARGSLSLSSMIPRSWLMVVAEQSERNGGCLGGVHPILPYSGSLL